MYMRDENMACDVYPYNMLAVPAMISLLDMLDEWSRADGRPVIRVMLNLKARCDWQMRRGLDALPRSFPSHLAQPHRLSFPQPPENQPPATLVPGMCPIQVYEYSFLSVPIWSLSFPRVVNPP
jgi:hypothetical protein